MGESNEETAHTVPELRMCFRYRVGLSKPNRGCTWSLRSRHQSVTRNVLSREEVKGAQRPMGWVPHENQNQNQQLTLINANVADSRRSTISKSVFVFSWKFSATRDTGSTMGKMAGAA